MKLKYLFLTGLLCSFAAMATDVNEKMTEDELIKAAEQLIAQNSAEKSTEVQEASLESESISEVKPVSGKSEAPTKREIAESKIPAFRGDIKDKEESGSPWVRMLLGTGVIILMSIGLLIFVKRYGKKIGVKTSGVALDVVSQRAISPKQNLLIVRVAGEHILLGATDHSINYIKSISLIDDEAEDGLPQDFNNFLEDDFVEQPLGKSKSERNYSL